MKENLLKIRKALKKKKPFFLRQDAHKKGKVSNNWRKPKGSDSKMRVGKKGYRRSVEIGWKSPALVKGASPEGLMPVTVNSVSQLQALNPAEQCAVISSQVGNKKRIAILQEASKSKVNVMNFKDVAKAVEALQKAFEEKKKAKTELKKLRDDKKEATKKAAEKKKAEEKKKEEEAKKEEAPAEDKKLEEKKEQEKILRTKQ